MALTATILKAFCFDELVWSLQQHREVDVIITAVIWRWGKQSTKRTCSLSRVTQQGDLACGLLAHCHALCMLQSPEERPRVGDAWAGSQHRRELAGEEAERSTFSRGSNSQGKDLEVGVKPRVGHSRRCRSQWWLHLGMLWVLLTCLINIYYVQVLCK